MCCSDTIDPVNSGLEFSLEEFIEYHRAYSVLWELYHKLDAAAVDWQEYLRNLAPIPPGDHYLDEDTFVQLEIEAGKFALITSSLPLVIPPPAPIVPEVIPEKEDTSEQEDDDEDLPAILTPGTREYGKYINFLARAELEWPGLGQELLYSVELGYDAGEADDRAYAEALALAELIIFREQPSDEEVATWLAEQEVLSQEAEDAEFANAIFRAELEASAETSSRAAAIDQAAENFLNYLQHWNPRPWQAALNYFSTHKDYIMASNTSASAPAGNPRRSDESMRTQNQVEDEVRSENGNEQESNEDRDRVLHATAVLDDWEALAYHALQNDETIPQTRLRFQKMLCGMYDPQIESSTSATNASSKTSSKRK